jgi:hypothetical protein
MSKQPAEGFPDGFSVQHIGVSAADAIADLPPWELVARLRERPEIAEALLSESYDKRFTPSSFIEERGKSFRVGWFSRDAKYQCVQEFSDLADTATDYLLLSLGKGRWRPPTGNTGADHL